MNQPATAAHLAKVPPAPSYVKHPKLVAWLDRFAAQVPAFNATKVAA